MLTNNIFPTLLTSCFFYLFANSHFTTHYDDIVNRGSCSTKFNKLEVQFMLRQFISKLLLMSICTVHIYLYSTYIFVQYIYICTVQIYLTEVIRHKNLGKFLSKLFVMSICTVHINLYSTNISKRGDKVQQFWAVS